MNVLIAFNQKFNNMKYKQKIYGGIQGTIGFLLSPLTWWDDAYVNIPLAYIGAWIVSLIYKPAFGTAFVINYWITNILGFVMMHKGANKILQKEGGSRPYSGKDIIKDIAVSLGYTVLMVVLIKLKVIKPIGDYFK